MDDPWPIGQLVAHWHYNGIGMITEIKQCLVGNQWYRIYWFKAAPLLNEATSRGTYFSQSTLKKIE